MRGVANSGINPTAPPDAVSNPPAKAVTNPAGQSNLENNMQAAKNPGSIYFWLLLLAIYFGWDWLQNHQKIREAIEPKNIRANAHNLIVILLAAVIGFNGGYVLLSKLANMNIPILSKVAGTFLPLFSV